jgi:hypothetical protein
MQNTESKKATRQQGADCDYLFVDAKGKPQNSRFVKLVRA